MAYDLAVGRGLALDVEVAPPQLGRVEPLQPRREGEVGREILLCLQADQVLDHLERGHRGALQQVLPRQQRAVEVAGGEHLGRLGHRTVIRLVSWLVPTPSPSLMSSSWTTRV